MKKLTEFNRKKSQ